MNGVGAHEVIVETPDHNLTMATMPDKAVEETLWAYRDRMVDLKNDRRFRYVLLFKNHGEPAGASLEHTHSQLIALPIVPKRVREEVRQRQALLRRKRALHFLRHDSTGNRNRKARHHRKRSFHRASSLRPALPVRNLDSPRQHSSAFENMASPLYGGLARLLRELLGRIDPSSRSLPTIT